MKKYHALSNFEIDSYFSGRPEYGGTYSKDMLPNKMENKFYIINLDDSTGLGSHWVFGDGIEANNIFRSVWGCSTCKCITLYEITKETNVLFDSPITTYQKFIMWILLYIHYRPNNKWPRFS